jgi:hypothetical protein
MLNKVFLIRGNKISSFITDEDSLKFSSKRLDTIEEFHEAWDKKISLATKIEIKYDSIRSVMKEDDDKDVTIKYKHFSEIEFSFIDESDYETFFSFLEKERFFTKRCETLTPWKAIRNYLIGILVVIGLTIFTYYQALEIANGKVEETSDGKTKLFNYVVGLLGDKGVILVGGLIILYLIYKIRGRYSNPPNQLKLSPINT